MTGGEHWNDVVKRYFREGWALDQFDSELLELARSSELIVRRHDLAALDRLEQWLVNEDVYSASISLGAFLREAARIAEIVPREHRLERRAMRQVANWQVDPSATRERIALLEQRFDILLNRALRQRNAVVHGVKTVADVVASVDACCKSPRSRTWAEWRTPPARCASTLSGLR